MLFRTASRPWRTDDLLPLLKRNWIQTWIKSVRIMWRRCAPASSKLRHPMVNSSIGDLLWSMIAENRWNWKHLGDHRHHFSRMSRTMCLWDNADQTQIDCFLPPKFACPASQNRFEQDYSIAKEHPTSPTRWSHCFPVNLKIQLAIRVTLLVCFDQILRFMKNSAILMVLGSKNPPQLSKGM